MPWMRTIAIGGAAVAVAVGGVTACGTSAVTSTSTSHTALGAANTAPTTPVTAPSAPTIASASTPTPGSHVVLKVKHPARIAASLSALDPISSVVATASHPVAVYAAPNGALLRHFSARTELGAPRTFLVAGTQGSDWLQVKLPIRPNG